MSTAARNQRLEALRTATMVWAERARTELRARVAANKKILKGRTGSERLAQTAVQAMSDLVVDEIDAFLQP